MMLLGVKRSEKTLAIATSVVLVLYIERNNDLNLTAGSCCDKAAQCGS